LAINDRFELEKLTINAYGDSMRTGQPLKSLKVMFNPESFSMKHVNDYGKLQALDTTGASARYWSSRPDGLALDLIFDGTGVGVYGASATGGPATPSVREQVDNFLKLCFDMDGDLHQPKFLKIQWGQGELKEFDCRLESVDITYTSFDRGGSPLRAKLATKFIEDLDPSKRIRLENKKSPDMSRSRVVKAGDTLPLLCKKLYGDPGLYLFVARANALDDFRNLKPGQTLLFPPL
jgi:Contractile injection system tube protein